MKKLFVLSLFLPFIVPSPASAQECFLVPDGDAINVCKGATSEEIAYIRDRRGAEINVQLSMIDSRVEAEEKRIASVRHERETMRFGYGKLKGAYAQSEKESQLKKKINGGLLEIKANIERLRKLPEQAVPLLLLELRHFMKESEQALDQHIESLRERLASAGPEQASQLQFSIEILLDLKSVKKEPAEKSDEIFRNPISPESLETNLSPMARVLFRAVADLEIFNKDALSSLAIIEIMTNKLLQELSFDLKKSQAFRSRNAQEQRSTYDKLEELRKTIESMEKNKNEIRNSRAVLMAELAGIPDKIRGLEMKQATGCAWIYRQSKTVCHAPNNTPVKPDPSDRVRPGESRR